MQLAQFQQKNTTNSSYRKRPINSLSQLIRRSRHHEFTNKLNNHTTYDPKRTHTNHQNHSPLPIRLLTTSHFKMSTRSTLSKSNRNIPQTMPKTPKHPISHRKTIIPAESRLSNSRQQLLLVNSATQKSQYRDSTTTNNLNPNHMHAKR